VTLPFRCRFLTAFPASLDRARIVYGCRTAKDSAMMPSTISAHVDLRESDTRKGRRLEYFTLGWNLTEAVVGIGAGLIAGSIALIGFGVDSIIESFSGASLLWRLQSGEVGERREQVALKLVGISFFVLAAYVAIDSTKTLIQREPSDTSIVGVCLAAVSIIVMPLLARAQAPCSGTIEQPCACGGLTPDRSLRLLVGHPLCRTCSQRAFWMVVGRFNSRNPHGSYHHA
jgi:hypothetical protein